MMGIGTQNPALPRATARRPSSAVVRWKQRLHSVVLPRLQARFAIEILAVQLIAVFAYQAAVQLRISARLGETDSFDTAQLLRDLFFDTLLTLAWVGPVVGLLAVLIALRLSHRFVGPVPRLRTAMKALADGDPGVRLCFRPGDALEGMDEDFNRLAAMLGDKRRERALERTEPRPGPASSASTDRPPERQTQPI